MIAALTVLKTRSFCRRAEGLNIIYEVAERISASTALSEKGPSAVDRPFKEGAIRFAVFDDRMHCAGHLGGDCCRRLTA